MKNVLVFPCGSEIGLELQRSLSRSAHFQLFGASSVPDHGRFVYKRYVGGIPMIDAPDFPDRFIPLLDEHRIDYVFPAHDSVVLALAGLREAGRLPAELLAPDLEVCRLCRSKSATYARFAGKIPVPAAHRPESVTDGDFPLFMKPDIGQGSRGAARVADPAAARERLRQSPGDLLLEYLPGTEYTVDCFTDRRGKLRFLSARERRRVDRGISVNCRESDAPDFARIGGIINAELPMRGPWFFQARENARGELALLEIAPRIAGSSGFQRAKGVNLPLLALYDRMGLDIEIAPNPVPGVELDRALGNSFRAEYEYGTVYVDFDETMVLGDGVNTDLVKFLYQCLNRGIRLVMLSRHGDDLEEELRRRRLDSLFDEVIHVPVDRAKSDYITQKRAILIDDSFAERKEAGELAGIPALDPSCIEALLSDID